jgi:cysteine desulfurase
MPASPVNLDAIAGSPMTPSVLAAWQGAAAQAFSDPARIHHAGRQAGLLLESARTSIANSLGVASKNVFFAGSAPDALRTAIMGIYQIRIQQNPSNNRILMGAVESLAVMNAVERIAPVSVTIGITETGAIDLTDWQQQIDSGASVACLQIANAEVGTRQPFAQALALARTAGVPVVADATAVLAFGPDTELPTDFDVIIAPARDWGGPPGIAILVTSPDLRWRPEEAPDRGWIGGFPDIPAAVGAAIALEEVTSRNPASARELIGHIRTSIESLENIECVGDPTNRLPHILTFTINGAAAGALVTELDKRGIFVASGSACTADTRMPSHVLQAMGRPFESSIRISLPATCTQQDIDYFLQELPAALDSVINN